jgi:hypothetical protein
MANFREDLFDARNLSSYVNPTYILYMAGTTIHIA